MFLPSNNNGSLTYFWNTMKTVLRGKIIAVMHIERTVTLSNLIVYFKVPEKQQFKSETNRRTEFIKIRVEINEIETKTTKQRISESQS